MLPRRLTSVRTTISQMLLDELARTSTAVAEVSGRRQKVGRLAATLRRLRPEEIAVAVAYLSGELPHAPIRVGWATLRDLPPAAAGEATLELLEVDAALRRVGERVGAGSRARRRQELESLFARATETERRFLFALLSGGLRQGALEGIMLEAVAEAAAVPPPAVRRAWMLSGNLGTVAAAAVADGGDGLGRFGLELFRPLQPMLAKPAPSLAGALAVGPAAVEWKLDGARLQVHRRGGDVRAYTRNLAEITDRVPELVEMVLKLPVQTIVLDGEAIGLSAAGRPRPFQETMSRFGSRLDVHSQRDDVPLSAFFFDCLHVDGVDLLDRPTRERLAALDQYVSRSALVPRIVTADAAEAEAFLAGALAQGHEGVMVKALDAPYEAGRRGAAWLKVKPAQTLDLVVLAAEWGHGRRTGWLSNLHLGARDPATGGFVMLGKTFKGMTDAMLAWQTARLLELETRRDRSTVYVRPELVAEVAFEGIQTSSRYPGGVALRFARVKGYRSDKRPEEADTIDAVRATNAVEDGG
jgi:DNA ligase-1